MPVGSDPASPQVAPTVVEPFCGAGGMALGLRRSSFSCAWASDTEPRAVATAVAAGLPAEVAKLDGPLAREIGRRFPPGTVDLVAGGPPCQGLSVAGKGLGKYDPRDGFPVMLALVREVLPRAVIIENVKGLVSARHRPYLDEIVADLDALGYVVPRCPDRGHPGRIHDAADWGTPQRRHRILIAAFRDPADARRFRWPSPTHHQSGLVWAKWGTQGEDRGGIVGGSYWAEHDMAGPGGAPSREEARVLREILAGRMEVRGPRWRTVRDALGGTLLRPEDGQGGLPQSRRAEDPDRPSSAVQGGGGESHHAPAVLGLVADGGRTKMPPHRPVHGVDEPSVALRGSAGGSSQPFAVIGAGTNPHGPCREAERSRRDITDEPSPAMTAAQFGNRGPRVAAQVIRYPVDGSHGTAGTEPGRLDEPSVTAMEAKGTRAHPGSGWDFHGGPDRAADGMYRAIGLRRLSPAECALLQGFPADWPWAGPKTSVYRAIGNACPPSLAEAVGLSIATVLSRPCGAAPPRRPWQSRLFGL